MAQSIEDSLLQALQNDDIKAFEALGEKARSGAYRLGRFPVLSLLYLYKSRKILSAYEEKLLKTCEYEALSEPVSVSKKFSSKAGKCLRLYLNETVSPLEMLLILDKTRRLKRVYPLTKTPSAVKERLKAIYSVKYGLNIKFDGDGIIIDRRPLSYREKKKIALSCICSALAVVIAVGVPVTTVLLIPKPVEGEVKKLSDIDFNSKEEYTLKRDIEIPENYLAEKVNCKIIGGGHKLIFKKGASLGQFNGKLSHVTLESCGDPVFTTISESAEIKEVTINVSAAVSSAESGALIAQTNYGTIDGVTVNITGSVNAVAPEVGVNQEFIFGGVVLYNAYKSSQSFGTIKNCTVNYGGFSLAGEAGVNASFGGVAGINSGSVQDCTVSGEIVSDTFDVAGVCYGNEGYVSGCLNGADIAQTSSSEAWNPIAGGVVLENVNVVEYCENRGDISAVSKCEQSDDIAVSAAGIVYLNSGTVTACKNSGEIYAEGNCTAFVGGICARSYGSVSYCLSGGGITVDAQTAFAGGISGRCEIATSVFNTPIYDFVRYCISESKISVTVSGDSKSCVGGVVGFVMEGSYVDTEIYFGGGVTDCYFTGGCEKEVSRFGNIVGACGANIYESNSYTSGGNEYHYFEGNIYLNNSLSAFGAKVTADGEFAAAEDKGAESATEEEIKNSEKYQSILQKLEK